MLVVKSPMFHYSELFIANLHKIGEIYGCSHHGSYRFLFQSLTFPDDSADIEAFLLLES